MQKRVEPVKIGILHSCDSSNRQREYLLRANKPGRVATCPRFYTVIGIVLLF